MLGVGGRGRSIRDWKEYELAMEGKARDGASTHQKRSRDDASKEDDDDNKDDKKPRIAPPLHHRAPDGPRPPPGPPPNAELGEVALSMPNLVRPPAIGLETFT